MERPASSSHKKHSTDNNTTDRAWTEQEDQKLLHHIQTHGHASWETVPKLAGLDRSWKSCRLRWTSYLRPDLKSGNFGEDEEDLIIKLHALLGNRWSLIAGRLPGRTDVEVQNYWNSHITAKLINMGIDPQNHRVRQIRTMHDVRQHHVHQSKLKEICDAANSDDDDEHVVSDAESIS